MKSRKFNETLVNELSIQKIPHHTAKKHKDYTYSSFKGHKVTSQGKLPRLT